MIGKLSGVIDSFETGHLILDVQGVGYLVHASSRTLSSVGQKGDAASLLIDTHVREDALTLYGFSDASEQAWFRLLNSVQGVGAKAAFAILAVCSPERLPMVIAAQDKDTIRQADGVGPKLAARIVTELKDKAGGLELGSGSTPKVQIVSDSSDSAAAPSFDQDAVSALINLGYARSDAYSAVMSASARSNDNLQDLIREALKELSA